MANIKVSELPTATHFDDDDYVMIVQSNTNKKITKENMYGNYKYSTTETVIGSWIDDKPIYRKVIYVGFLPNSGSLETSHNIQNLDKIINIHGVAIRSSDKDTLPIPYSTVNPTNAGAIMMYANETKVSIGTGADRTSYEAYVTLEYTKN